MDRQNLTLLTDLYELTMMQGYFKHKDRNETVIFDAFYRNNPCDGGYAIAAGLEQLVNTSRIFTFPTMIFVTFPVLVFSMRIFSTIWQISVSRVIFMPFRREQSFFRESLLLR